MKDETGSDQITNALHEYISHNAKKHNAEALYKLREKITALD